MLKLNRVSCTSKLCDWDRSRRQAEPAPLKQISFRRPKKDETVPNVPTVNAENLTGYWVPDPYKFSTDKQRATLDSLRAIAPKAAVFSSISLYAEESDGESTDTADEDDLNTLPELLTSLFDPTKINITDEKELVRISGNLYEEYKDQSTINQYNNLTKVTKKQRLSDKWMLYRAGRITASNCKKAFILNVSKPAKSTIESIMQYKTAKGKEINYGKKMEETAFKCYVNELSKKHEALRVETTGLHINHEFPFLGASPDGIVTCDCCEKRLLEIKCPFKFQKGLDGWKSNDKTMPINENNEMNIDHEYYYQIQLQMLVTDIKYCDFYVWSKGKNENDTFLITIQKDDAFCAKILEKLEQVFRKILLPELMTRKEDPINKQEHKLYCFCKKPSYEPMIACDSPKCKIEWFHYACVNLVRTPSEKKNWFCPNCIKRLKK